MKSKQLKVLVAMETSGKVREAFRKLGHDAWSCDILPADDASQYHFIGDIYDYLYTYKWDIIIAHPPCTKLSVSGNHVYAEGKLRHQERLDAIKWTENFWNSCVSVCDHVCFENPVGVLPTYTGMPKPQYIQPYEFGHDASKKTGLFLYGLPELKKDASSRFAGRFVNGKERFSNHTDSGQNKLGLSENRWKIRSETYQGIADAMADQWGSFL